MTRTYTNPLPWSETTVDFVRAAKLSIENGKVRRSCECGHCGKRWETEFEPTGKEQEQWFQCACGHDQQVIYLGTFE